MALVLGRNIGDSVFLIDSNGEEIKIEVVASSTGLLRLKIDAPKSVQIIRGEIYHHGRTDGATKN
jgi:carbon storage regulator